ncbi:MAG: Hint domain-containing protein [Thioclava sp.]|nr:Hint domain-containing protein [Thioclava sp.]MBD3804336.1 Hint domain-containing protein [Thioclava sp.]
MDVWGDESWTGDALCVPAQGHGISERRENRAKAWASGFARGTRMATKAGACAVEDLKPGMRLLTADHGYRDLLGVMPRPEMAVTTIRIAAGALGNERALTLPPRQRLVLQAGRGTRHGREVRIAAQDLVGRPGITRAEEAIDTWWQLRFKRTEIVFAEGLRVESLRSGVRDLRVLARHASPLAANGETALRPVGAIARDTCALQVQPASPSPSQARPTLPRTGGIARFLAG